MSILIKATGLKLCRALSVMRGCRWDIMSRVCAYWAWSRSGIGVCWMTHDLFPVADRVAMFIVAIFIIVILAEIVVVNIRKRL